MTGRARRPEKGTEIQHSDGAMVNKRLKTLFVIFSVLVLLPASCIAVASCALGGDLRLLFFVYSYFDHGIKFALIHGAGSLRLLSWAMLLASICLAGYSVKCKKYYKTCFFTSLVLVFLVAVLGLGVMP
jgi:hypothetical protein